ncbi:MAG TPA: hypothetical protein VLF66_06605 [Thermoanaerobaculia bacterium]|nr:hypothetical protein [Thermoanaerobaculia bacterium]
MPDPLEQIIGKATSGAAGPVYLVVGDRVLAEPAAERLAAAVAEKAGCEVETHRRPPSLTPLLSDLRTFALFAPAKVVLAVETGVLADRAAAAAFLDEAGEALPLSGGGEGGASIAWRGAERRAAVRLLQAIRLFDLDPYEGEPAAVLGRLPDWAFQGASGRRTKKAEELREGLAALLEGARREGIEGFAQEEVSELAAVVKDGLPEGHVLVLAESAVAAEHPVVAALEERGGIVRLARVESGKGGWTGLPELVAELARQTGVGIDRPALEALARRTLKGGSGWGTSPAEADSTARFAGEYRKLAHLAQGLGRPRIGAEMVEEAVEDRGQEDVFKILDAVGEGRGEEGLDRLRRYLAAASDAGSARLSFFGLFAGFCRNLTAVRGMMRAAGVRPGERNYNRFKDRQAPVLQRDLDGFKSPLAGQHPYRLHRAYLAASTMDEAYLARLPWRVLETELALKGESGSPEAALAELMLEVAAQARP